MSKIIIIGEILVDLSLDFETTKLRLGGIIHSFRGAWSMNMEVTLGFISPSYLDEKLIFFLNSHSCHSFYKIGDIIGSPNIILIKNTLETMSQGYELILKDEKQINLIDDNVSQLNNHIRDNIDILLFPGNYSINSIITNINTSTSYNLHIDFSNAADIHFLTKNAVKVKTLIFSTSSTFFLDSCKGDVNEAIIQLREFADFILFKENRGGS